LKDPLILTIWTFLDILKMSIFGFLDGIFFRRTEKSEMKIWVSCRTENGKENICKNQRFYKNSEIPKIKDSILATSWLHYGYIMKSSQNVAKKSLLHT
jgi:hypothetical protein